MALRPKTFVYVDGYNLYYRAVRGTPYRWLDIQRLCEQILPNNDILEIKYFTASIGTRGDSQKPIRQETFFRAIRAMNPKVKIIKGKYEAKAVTRELIHSHWINRLRRIVGKPNRKVKVYNPQEKGSDVNLATQLLNDAWRNRYDVAVVISNDSDLLGAIRLVRHERGKAVGNIYPMNSPNLDLYHESDFKVELRPAMLAAAQFPTSIPGTNIHKPASW